MLCQNVVVRHNIEPKENGMTLGKQIRELRIAAHLSQRALAARVGVSFPHISKIEADIEQASTELLVRIAKEVGSDADKLLLCAQRVPEELREAVAAKPELALRFLRSWRSGHITDADVQKLIDNDHGEPQ